MSNVDISAPLNVQERSLSKVELIYRESEQKKTNYKYL